MIKYTDPELLRNHVLSFSKWITVEDFYQQAPEAGELRLVEKWKQESKIFTLVHENIELIPEYILERDGNPKPIVQAILHLFESKNRPWQSQSGSCPLIAGSEERHQYAA